MQVTPEITFNHMERSPKLESLVQRRIAKLERYCDHITSCETVVEKAQDAVTSGSEYRVRVMVRVPPRHELVGTREQGNEHRQVTPDEAIHQAFDAVERQVKDLSEKQREHSRERPPAP